MCRAGVGMLADRGPHPGRAQEKAGRTVSRVGSSEP